MDNGAIGAYTILDAQIQHARGFARFFEGKNVAIVSVCFCVFVYMYVCIYRICALCARECVCVCVCVYMF